MMMIRYSLQVISLAYLHVSVQVIGAREHMQLPLACVMSHVN